MIHLIGQFRTRRLAAAELAAMIGAVWAAIPTLANGPCGPLELAKLVAADRDFSDQFGFAVALRGDTALIGSRLDDHSGIGGAGSAYVFTRDAGQWNQQAKLTASDPGVGDHMGKAVALEGEYAVVGANAADLDGLVNAGAAYIFVRSGGDWTEQTKLTASDPGAGDEFGVSADLEGDTAFIGALVDDHEGGVDAGSLYVFVRSGGAWTQTQKLTASDASAGAKFGSSVDIDGNQAVIGSYVAEHEGMAGAGAAYLFERSDGAWSQVAKLTAPDAAADDQFGFAVSLQADTLLIGARNADPEGLINAGAAYVFVRSKGEWILQVKLTSPEVQARSFFGRAVSLDGETALISAYLEDHSGETDAGAAYMFIRSGIQWTYQAKLTAGDARRGDEFGREVALDGETVLIGARLADPGGTINAGAAYIFDRRTVAGDIDADGDVDGGDAVQFVEVLLGQDQDSLQAGRADLDCSGDANGFDIQPFIDAMIGP